VQVEHLIPRANRQNNCRCSHRHAADRTQFVFRIPPWPVSDPGAPPLL